MDHRASEMPTAHCETAPTNGCVANILASTPAAHPAGTQNSATPAPPTTISSTCAWPSGVRIPVANGASSWKARLRCELHFLP